MGDVTTTNQINTYLTFVLLEEQYAVNVSNVTSVVDFSEITKVPKTPDYMRGVINLRGSVVPVIDLKLKFGLGETEKTIDSGILIMEVKDKEETVTFGILADSVEEVIELEPSQIEPTPKLGTAVDTDFIKGMGKKDDDFLIILDIEKVFSEEELIEVSEPRAGKEATKDE
ncbi:MAG: chemotaxis protein CheW [Spirochaetales bacterium]|nr:chemotaxis protein CheW [Spirochaetales bacterium]MCF7938790.1 chemotaxis protein CheW [Spirochaetales bacterium]